LRFAQARVLVRALADAVAAELGQRAPGGDGHAGVELGMRAEVPFDLVGQTQLQVVPFPQDLAQAVALLPAVESVSGRTLLLLDRQLLLVHTAAGAQLALEGVEDLGNAVVELNARESRCRRERGISLRCLAPRGEDGIASRLEMRCEIEQRV